MALLQRDSTLQRPRGRHKSFETQVVDVRRARGALALRAELPGEWPEGGAHPAGRACHGRLLALPQ